MAANSIIPFAQNATGADILSDTEYQSDPQTLIGNQQGIARRALNNKALKQATALASALAQFTADNQAADVTDALSPSALSAMIKAAVSASVGGTSDPSTILARNGTASYATDTVLPLTDSGKVVTYTGTGNATFTLPDQTGYAAGTLIYEIVGNIGMGGSFVDIVTSTNLFARIAAGGSAAVVNDGAGGWTTLFNTTGNIFSTFYVADGFDSNHAMAIGQARSEFAPITSASQFSGVDSGAVNAYASEITGITVYYSGLLVWVSTPLNTNTGASTFAINALSALPIHAAGGHDLEGGEIAAGFAFQVRLNTGMTAWELIDTTGGAIPVSSATKNLQAPQLGQVKIATHFGYNPASTTGLTFGLLAGAVRSDATVSFVPAGTVALTASATNYIEVTTAGSVSVNQSGFTAGSIPLWTVVTDASSITSMTDMRTALSSGGGASAAPFTTTTDVTASRVAGTTYTNSGTSAKIVKVYAHSTGTATFGSYFVTLKVTHGSVTTYKRTYVTDNVGVNCAEDVIPPGATYSFTIYGTGTVYDQCIEVS